MICKACKKPYRIDPNLDCGFPPMTLFEEFDGWHYSYGECFWCYSWAVFGWRMGPWGDAAEREKQIYTITPPGVPSPLVYPDAQAEIDAMSGDELEEVGF